jgi:coproporphyrinogen III oxidase
LLHQLGIKTKTYVLPSSFKTYVLPSSLSMSTLTRDDIAKGMMTLQDYICKGLEDIDGKATFITDKWERPGGGGGRSRIIRDGAVLEKGGVMFSAVHGPVSDRMSKMLELQGTEFFATGVSIVLHPESPMMPIIHMNVRYFEMTGGTWWFGGGIDLTPHYIVPEQATWFHQQVKDVCDKTDPSYYSRFKTWADDYFFIKHRQETRGVGGIFYDRLGANEPVSKEGLWEMSQNIGHLFVEVYRYMAEHNRSLPYTEKEVEWQRLRRGRYTEFNLVYDAGTKFGLETDGRTESILVSLPPLASWEYCHEPVAGSREAETLSLLRKDIDWLEPVSA